MRPFFLPMNTLIVAHYSADLTDLLDEVAVAASEMGATLVLGAVTERMIADKTRGQKFELVIITGHGTESGYVISDGELSPTALAAYVRRWKASKVILNCCCSWRWVPVIQRLGNIEVVAANTDDLDDRDAWRAMEDILHGLRDGLSLQASADPSTSHSFWGVRGEELEGNAAMSEYNQYIRELEKTLKELQLGMASKDASTEARLKEIEKSIALVKSEMAAKADIEKVKSDLSEMRKDIASIKRETDFRTGKNSSDWKINLLIVSVILEFIAVFIMIYGLANWWGAA